MKHRNSHFVVGYWSRIRQGRQVPDQADIDPRAIKRVLASTFLLDMHAEANSGSSAIYRLAGTTLCDRFGGELRGKSFLSHWDPDSRATLKVLLRQSLHMRAPLCLTSIGATEDCRMIEIETVLMPVSFGGNQPERFLGVAQMLNDAAALGGRAIAFERLVASAIVQEGETAGSDAPPPSAAIPDERLRSHPRAPHLRLVVSRQRAPDPLRLDPEETLEKIFKLCGAARINTRAINAEI